MRTQRVELKLGATRPGLGAEEGVEDRKVEEVEVFKAEAVEDPRLLNLTINDLASLMMPATHLN